MTPQLLRIPSSDDQIRNSLHRNKWRGDMTYAFVPLI